MTNVAAAMLAAILAVSSYGYAEAGRVRPRNERKAPTRAADAGAAARKDATSLNTSHATDWAVRVIPLPHEMKIAHGVTARADQIVVITPPDSSPQVSTAVGILRAFARGDEASPCRIRLLLAPEGDSSLRGLPGGLAERLRGLPNPDQAYAITTRRARNGAAHITLMGNTPQGLLYAARTLQQLVSPPETIAPDTPLVLPVGEIVDWPDILERGQWGEDPEDDLAWMSRWKLNTVEVEARVGCDDRGQPTIRFKNAKIAEGAKLGIKVIPFFGHMEHLGRGGLKGWEDCYSTPTPERAMRSDFQPSLCWSKPRSRELLARWMKLMAAIPGVQDMMVWLSEEATPCTCELCAGKEPYEVEVSAIIAGFRQAQAEVNPAARLRILTSQGSYPVNDKVLAAVPDDVGITYYDGSRTYDSSHQPMIYPLLERFARSGGQLGVYPQVTNAWGTVMPWTAPQFIRARMNEFYRKRLANVIYYAVPSHHFHAFNCTAAAEWSWNHDGRTPREFARAFARAAGIPDIESFAEWAEKIGPVGWDIAGTKLFLRMMYDPTMGLGEAAPLDHRFQGGPEVVSREQIEHDLAQAREALAIARRMNLPEAVDETEIYIGSVKLLRALYQLSHVPADASKLSPAEVRSVAAALDTLDQSAAATSTRLRRWGPRVCERTDDSWPGRLTGTIQVALRTASVVRGIIGERVGISDPYPEHRYQELGRWSAEDFAAGPRQTLTFDATDCITQPGDYSVCLRFIESAYGTDIRDVAVVAMDGDTRRQVLSPVDPVGGVSMWERYNDAMVPVPEVLPGCRYVVEIEVRGLPADAPPDRKTCSGAVGLRRDWPADSVDEAFFTK